MRALRANRRPGMTLVELLVVISIIILLVALGLMVSPRLAEDQRSVRSADLISGWLLGCKNRAYRDQQVRGIRLIPGPDGHAHELVLVERPEDYRGGILEVPSKFASGGELPSATAFLHGKDLTNNQWPNQVPPAAPPNEYIVDGCLDPSGNATKRGDFLVFDSLETIPYNSHHIFSVKWVPPNPQAPLGGTHIVCATYDKQRYSIINGGAPIPVAIVNGQVFGTGYSQSDQFRFVRQPRPLVGEPTLQLPRDMAVDLQLPQAQGGTFLPALIVNSGTPPADTLDILFGPRGQLQGSNSSLGKVVLRVRNVTRAPDDGDQLLIVIYTRTGVISTHPVNLTAGQNPYSFLYDGNSSGF